MKKSLIGFKGLLSVAIFFHHLNYGLIFGGGAAVTYFFIISGFLIALGYQGKFCSLQPPSYFNFLLKRLARLYPLHLFTFLLSLLPIYLGNEIANIKPGLAIKNLLLLTSLTNCGRDVFAFNSLSWYLSTIVALYLITPIIIFSIHHYKLSNSLFKLSFCLIIVFLIGFGIAYYKIDNMEAYSFGWWFIYISPYYRIFDYLIGIILGYVYIDLNEFGIRRKFPMNSIIYSCFEILIVYLTFSWLRSGFIPVAAVRYDMFYVPFAVFLILLLSFQKGIVAKLFSSKLFLYIGNISFEIFMLHQLFIRIVAPFLNLPLYGFPQSRQMLLVQIGLLLVIVVFSDVIHNYFVKPMAAKILAIRNGKP
ncbi:MAG: acyltransferase family protein [Oscillospiraceae bacterium]|jgi:peptidoglycan/LPS O-acetylase OafA/YrhL|nr:acyltransferase family protein [Oscillospiraceae bacterium]